MMKPGVSLQRRSPALPRLLASRPCAGILLVLHLLALHLLAPPVHAASSSSLLVGVQDRRLDFDLGVAGQDPIANEQTSVRSTLTWNLSDRWTFVAQGSGASSYLELNDTRLTGLTDVKVRALFRPTEAWAVGAGTILPFGLYELTANEVTTAQWAWIPGAGYPLNRFGEGFGWEVTAARAFRAGPGTTLGLAAAYLRHAEFQLLAGEAGDYRLGDEVGLSAGADWESPSGRTFGVDAVYRLFGADQISGSDAIEQGDQFDGGVRLGLPFGPFTTTWSLRGAWKGDNEITDRTDPDSVAQIAQAPGTYLSVDGRIGYALTRTLAVSIEGSLIDVSGSDYLGGAADGATWSAGPGIGWRAAPGIAFGARYQYVHGTKDAGIDIDGHDLLVTMELTR